MAILRQLIPTVMSLALVSCYEEFTPDVDITPVLCINSLIKSGKPVEVSVTRTFLFTDQNADHHVSDAVVRIYANGERVGDEYIPAEGDIIKIEAESATYGLAEGEVRVPYAAPIMSFEFSPLVISRYSSDDRAMSGSVQFNIDVALTVADQPDVDNYFRLDYKVLVPRPDGYPDSREFADYDPEHDYYAWLMITSLQSDQEPIFGEHIGALDAVMGADSYGFTFFTDRQFADKSYTLHLAFPDCRYQVSSAIWRPELLDCGIRFTVSTISKSLYDWANYRWQAEDGLVGDLSEVGLAEPLWGYSNVSTRAGVIAAQSSVEYTLHLNDFLQDCIFTRGRR